MNEYQKSKITVEINRLEKEILRLEDRAKSDESEHASAWETYGSELAGPPVSIGIARHTARDLGEKVAFLRSILVPSGKIESLHDLELERLRLEAEIARLNQEKMLLYHRMSLARYLDSIIK